MHFLLLAALILPSVAAAADGPPGDILLDARPHIGSNKLPRVITFVASLYSIGLPPELLSVSVLNDDELDAVRAAWENFDLDLREASGVVQVVIRDEDVAHNLRAEYCLQITGTVSARPEGNQNPNLPTGEIEVFAREDDPDGDREGFIGRSEAWYRRAFDRAGFVGDLPPVRHCGFERCQKRAVAEHLLTLGRTRMLHIAGPEGNVDAGGRRSSWFDRIMYLT